MKLSIIIPVFNEDKTIIEILNRVISAKVPKEITKEIIVVDDGSFDNTGKIIESVSKKELKYIRHSKNIGKGAAVRTGIENSSGDLILIQDADLEYDPSYYSTMLEPILKKEASIVYGTRLVNYPLKLWGKNKTVLPLHLLANKFLTGLVNILYKAKLTDMETCYKLSSREILKKINLKSNRFEIEPEITIKCLKLGYNIIEVPIKASPRNYNEGKKIGFKDGIQAIWTIVKYKFTN